MTSNKTPICTYGRNSKTVQTKRKGEIEKIESYIKDVNGERLERKWIVVDAADKPLGRLAVQIARILQGKHRPYYTPNVDTGDFVIVVNAEKVALTGNKLLDKKYYRHSGYPGGIKERTAQEMRQKFPIKMVKLAVKRMLPKNVLGQQMLKKLKVYEGNEHKHQAQKPELMEILK
jgi:large subunit ribosomal protein L13